MTATLDQATAPQPITIERFRAPGISFETNADLGLARRAFGEHGRPEKGTVIVMLDMDGDDRDHVVVEEYFGNLSQLDQAIEALTKARNALR